MSSTKSSTKWPQVLTGHYKNRSKIREWASVIAAQQLEDAAEDQRKNQEAESSWARRKLWGSAESEPGSGSTEEGEDMRQTILGDITHPAPIIIPQQNNLGAVAATLATLALGGLGGYLLNKSEAPKPEPVEQRFDDESLSVGLGRIEDYLDPGK